MKTSDDEIIKQAAAIFDTPQEKDQISREDVSRGFKYWFRWIAVLPGALIIGFLATFPLHWILTLLFALHEEPDLGSPGFFVDIFGLNAEKIELFLYPAVIAAVYIIAGYKIAPRYKFMTALVLFGIYVGAWLVAIIFSSSLNGVYNITWGRGLLALLGLAAGLFEVKTENDALKDIA